MYIYIYLWRSPPGWLTFQLLISLPTSDNFNKSVSSSDSLAAADSRGTLLLPSASEPLKVLKAKKTPSC